MWERTARDQRQYGAWDFELRDDEIADLRWQGRPVLRSIRAVIRDADWATAALVIDSVEDSLTGLTLHVRSGELGAADLDSVFRGSVTVQTHDDSVTVAMDLRSSAAFETNRTGLVVLCPPQAAGADLFVEHTDASTEATRFPHAISPHQPVFDIAALHWEQNGLDIGLRLVGDVFEMEDQRNWTDASFKVYSRPLSLPFPYRIDAGESITQSVTVSCAATSPVFDDRMNDAVIELERAGLFPAIGIGAASGPDPAPSVPAIGSSVLVELDLASSNWSAALSRAASGGEPVDVRFVLDPERPGALDDAVAELAGRRVLRVAAFQQTGDARHVSDREAIRLLRSALTAHSLNIPVVGGSRAHFTELNRERHRLPDDLDGVAVTATPLFHARDTEQLVESVPMQRLIAQQTVGYADGAPVHIGPICIRPRFNDVATVAQPSPTRTDLAAGYGAEFTGANDPRQSSTELAAWTIASAAALAVPGVASISWFEQWGPCGIRTAAGVALPVEAAIRALVELSGAELLWDLHPDGTRWVLGARCAEGTTVLAANIGAVARAMTIRTPSGEVTVTLAPGTFARLPL